MSERRERPGEDLLNAIVHDRFQRKRTTDCTFGSGVHTCPGAGLARSEVAIMVEEWTRAIPEVRLDPAKKAVASSGLVKGMLELHLVLACLTIQRDRKRSGDLA
ncbi:hypothetical protein AB3X96_22805 [Paraburkholderia sp. BR13439]|uniref:hypothetical protein n=1 Tax=Paraburkholderia sp. BR13439 TaxID=3236996 RepID=UPI0034CEE194